MQVFGFGLGDEFQPSPMEVKEVTPLMAGMYVYMCVGVAAVTLCHFKLPSFSGETWCDGMSGAYILDVSKRVEQGIMHACA